jgi:hypothetical protein
MPEVPDDMDEKGGGPEEGPILSPEELDISDDEHVTQLDEGRFVVSPEKRDTKEAQQQQPQPTPEPQPEQQTDSTASELDQEQVHQWLRESFEGPGSRYGFDVTATFDGSVSQRRMASNDVVTIFESLILWYAQQIDNNTPVEEILGILLMEANVPIRYPPQSLQKLVQKTGLGPDDTIADLLAAVEDGDGVQL